MHLHFISKLIKIGFANPFLSCPDSFSTNKLEFVKFKHCIYNHIFVISSILQGDHLSPLLCNPFINDIILALNYLNTLLFTDNAYIFKLVNSNETKRFKKKKLQFGNANGLTFNNNKCNIISFSKKKRNIIIIYTNSITRVSQIENLGIIFDSKLLFNIHTFEISKKALSF